METKIYIYTLNDPDNLLVRYVGSSKNTKKRFQKHLEKINDTNRKAKWVRELLMRNKKPILEIIDEVPVDERDFWETHYMKLYRSSGAQLLNSTTESRRGLLKEIRERNSKARKGIHTLSPEQQKINVEKMLAHNRTHGIWNKGANGKHTSNLTQEQKLLRNAKSKGKHNAKRILQYDLNGNFIKEWESAYEFKKQNNIPLTRSLGETIKINGIAFGHLWKFKDGEIQQKINPANPRSIKGKPVSQFSLGGELIAEFTSPKEAQEKTGCSLVGISASCLKENKSYKGFLWKYK